MALKVSRSINYTFFNFDCKQPLTGCFCSLPHYVQTLVNTVCEILRRAAVSQISQAGMHNHVMV